MLRRLVRLQVIIGGLLGGFVMLLASFDLITRYLWKAASQEWYGEVVVYLVVWNAFLVCGLLVAEDAHVRVDSLTAILPDRARRIAGFIGDLLCFAFCTMLAWLAATFAWGEYEMQLASSSPLRFPMWIYSSSLVVGCVLMAMHYLIRLCQAAAGRGA